MLKTPLGDIEIYFDNKIQKNITIVRSKKNCCLYPDITYVYLLNFQYHSNQKEHILKCIFHTKEKGNIESGEHLEAISFYINHGKITIGCKSDFCQPKEGNFDYNGDYIDNGIEIFINSSTKSQNFIFAISWLINCTDKNDVQTWFASDPSIHQ